MVRGSGKFKTRRGGGRNFSRNMELNSDGIAVARSRKPEEDDVDEDDEDDNDDEEEEEEEESEEEESKPNGQELSRADRKALKKQGKTGAAGENEGDEDLINPNHVTAKSKKISDLSAAPRQLSRREREEKEKKEAKERYWKLHMEGKTDQAKSDLARLAQVKKEREEAAAKRKAEQEAKKAEIEAKIAAQKKK